MGNKLLTIAITTYNRKEPLLEVLKALEKQGQYDKYEIVISNNHSDYDVDEWLRSNLSSEFFDIISIFNREVNVGGDINISFIFQLVRTPWMWLASDDDPALPDAIQLLFNDIDNYPDVCWIKYSIKGYHSFRNIEHHSLAGVFGEICRKDHFYGEMVFMGNNVYNMRIINQYVGDIPINAKTSMPHLVAPLMAISQRNEKMRFSSSFLTNYIDGRRSYPMIYAYMNFTNLIYTDVLKDKEDISAFKRIKFGRNRDYVKTLLLVEDGCKRWEYFKKIFIAHYGILTLRGISFYLLYVAMNILPKSIHKRLIHY